MVGNIIDLFYINESMKHLKLPTHVRPNVDPTFIRSWDPGDLGGTTMAPLFSRIHTSLINIWTTISQALV